MLEMRLVAGERPVSEAVRQARYEATLSSPLSASAMERLARAKAGEEIRVVRTRKGESEEIALGPQLRDLTWDGDGNVSMTLALDAGATLRPGEILRSLVGEEAAGAAVRRSELWVERRVSSSRHWLQSPEPAPPCVAGTAASRMRLPARRRRVPDSPRSTDVRLRADHRRDRVVPSTRSRWLQRASAPRSRIHGWGDPIANPPG